MTACNRQGDSERTITAYRAFFRNQGGAQKMTTLDQVNAKPSA